MERAIDSKIKLPFPHVGQRKVRFEARRFNWLSAGRRWRKTTLAMSICVERAIVGGVILWAAPTYNQVRVGMDETRKATGGAAKFNLSRMEAVFPRGGKIIFRSLDDPDTARGYTAHGIVMDECADLKPEAWREVLRPMLIDTDGWLWAIGTPKGKNWFYAEHVSARDRADSMAWQAPTVGVDIVDGKLVRKPHPLENPFVSFSEIERLFAVMPERSFRQEVLAEFIESNGSVFRRVMDAATATPQEQGQRGRAYVAGVDLARKVDFTVITIIDISGQVPQVVYVDRFNQVDWAIQVGRIKAAADRFDVEQLIVDQTGVGDPITEQLQRELRCAVVGTQITNATKSNMINALALAFERNEISIIPDAVLINELQAYEMERLPSGLMRYNAPEGLHDDCVMSLALAYQAVAQPQWLLG